MRRRENRTVDEIVNEYGILTYRGDLDVYVVCLVTKCKNTFAKLSRCKKSRPCERAVHLREEHNIFYLSSFIGSMIASPHLRLMESKTFKYYIQQLW